MALNEIELLLRKQIAKEDNQLDISTTGVFISHKLNRLMTKTPVVNVSLIVLLCYMHVYSIITQV